MADAFPAVGGAARPVLLLLAGQGTQRQGMGVGLYDVDPVFTASVDQLFALMGDEGRRVRADWLSEHPDVSIDDASRAQPLLFAVNYGLGQALRARGITPQLLLGHSVGELAAGCLAGVFDLGQAAELLLARSQAMASVPAGGMLAVASSPERLAGRLGSPDDPAAVVIAAVNAPRQTVLAGPCRQLAAIARQLLDTGVTCRSVPARQPFHSPAVGSAVPVLMEALGRRPLRAPQTAIQSTRTGLELSAADAVRPEFWAGQIAAPVLFWPALDAVLDRAEWTLVAAGPAVELAVLARRHPAVQAGRTGIVQLPVPAAGQSAVDWNRSVDALAR